MPIYEYRCRDCLQPFSKLFMSKTAATEEGKVNCPFCGKIRAQKLISSFSVHQSERARLAALDTSKPRGSDYYRDNRNIGLWAKKRMKELGMQPSDQVEEVIERARSGKILNE